jgi:hypothetical protein
MKKKKILTILQPVLLFTLILLAGCSANGDADMIGSYPDQTEDDSTYDTLPANSLIVYHAQVDLEVSSVDYAVDRIQGYAGKYGGYTTYIYRWYQDGDEHATVIVSVPSINYEALHDRIIRLGDLEEETIIGELKSGSYRSGSQIEMSTLTIHLAQKGWSRPSSTSGWRPLETFSDAFEVAGVIFRFLIDVLIWVAVIAGPFALFGWGIRQIARRWQISIKKKDQEE